MREHPLGPSRVRGRSPRAAKPRASPPRAAAVASVSRCDTLLARVPPACVVPTRTPPSLSVRCAHARSRSCFGRWCSSPRSLTDPPRRAEKRRRNPLGPQNERVLHVRRVRPETSLQRLSKAARGGVRRVALAPPRYTARRGTSLPATSRERASCVCPPRSRVEPFDSPRKPSGAPRTTASGASLPRAPGREARER